MSDIYGRAERVGGDGPVTYTPQAATFEAAARGDLWEQDIFDVRDLVLIRLARKCGGTRWHFEHNKPAVCDAAYARRLRRMAHERHLACRDSSRLVGGLAALADRHAQTPSDSPGGAPMGRPPPMQTTASPTRCHSTPQVGSVDESEMRLSRPLKARRTAPARHPVRACRRP